MNTYEAFLKEVGNRTLSAPVPNFAPLFVGSGFNTRKYYTRWYNTIPGTPLLLVAQKDMFVGWMTEKGLHQQSEEFLPKTLQDPSQAKDRLKEFETRHTEISKLYETHTYAYLKNQSIKHLQEIAEKIFENLWDTNSLVFFAYFLDKAQCEATLTNLPNLNINLDTIWEQGTQSATPSFETVDTWNIINKRLDKWSDTDVIEYAQYTTCSYIHAGTLEEVSAQIHPLLNKSSKELGRELVTETDHWNKRREEFLHWQSTRTPDEARLLDYLQIVIYLRDARKHFIRKGLTIIWRIAETLLLPLGFSHQDLPFILRHELTGNLKKLTEQKNTLQARKQGCLVYVSEDGQTFVQTTPHLNEIQAQLEKRRFGTIDPKETTLKGQSASPGVAKGVARVVLHQNDFSHFKDGEILVTGMTRPEFVPLMKKASAIVTDEGGITCHAAIVSRELGIPCVIGTKYATQWIQDGNTVTVDGNRGTITK